MLYKQNHKVVSKPLASILGVFPNIEGCDREIELTEAALRDHPEYTPPRSSIAEVTEQIFADLRQGEDKVDNQMI